MKDIQIMQTRRPNPHVPLVQLEPMPEEVPAKVGTRYIGGEEVSLFEELWARQTGNRLAVGCGSGTDALTLLMREIARRGEQYHPDRKLVLIPAMSFVTTLEAVLAAGLDPVPVDTDAWGNMSMSALAQAIKGYEPEAILAIVPVHLYGRVVEIPEHMRMDVPYVVEDACQAHGAWYPSGGRVGSRHAAAWSFMPAKILGACGDAGAVTFPSGWEDAAENVRAEANHGRASKNRHVDPGTNSRLDAIQAAVLNERLPELNNYLADRERCALWYNERLADFVQVQPNSPGRVWTYYTIRTETMDERAQLQDHLDAYGIQTGCHYPYTLDRAFSNFPLLGGDFPMARAVADTTLTLPLWPGMPGMTQAYVANHVRNFYEAGR